MASTAGARLGPSAALLAGAAAFFLLRPVLGLGFEITPLVVGVTAVAAAALTAPARRSWVVPGILVGWGLAVLLSREGILPPEREGAATLVGIGAGLLLGAVATPAARRVQALRGGGLALVGGGLLFYLSYDVAELRTWWVWALGLVVAALAELRSS